MAYEDLWQLPTFLFFASVANIIFLVRSVRDLRNPKAERGAAIAMLALSISSLTWALPCFIQCLATLIVNGGDEWFVPVNSDTGCAIMGFYSVFGSITGQIVLAEVALISILAAEKEIPPKKIIIVTTAAFVSALIFCVSVAAYGGYAYSGEGFCYIDWSDEYQVTFMMLVTVPCLIVVLTCYGIMLKRCIDGTAAAKLGVTFWLVASLAYFSAWILWIPAAFMGTLSDKPYPEMFPDGMMIAGALFGHAQAIVNPVLYGIYWRRGYVDAAVPKYSSHV